MRPSGTIWDHIGPYVTNWSHMGPYDAMLGHLGPYGTIWDHVGPHDILGLPGVSWGLLRPPGVIVIVFLLQGRLQRAGHYSTFSLRHATQSNVVSSNSCSHWNMESMLPLTHQLDGIEFREPLKHRCKHWRHTGGTPAKNPYARADCTLSKSCLNTDVRDKPAAHESFQTCHPVEFWNQCAH